MVQLHTLDGKTIECRGKLLEIEDTLKNKGFLRIQKALLLICIIFCKSKTIRHILGMEQRSKQLSEIIPRYVVNI